MVNQSEMIMTLLASKERIESINQNGKTTTVTRDIDDRIEVLEEVVDAEPTKITRQEIVRDINDRVDRIDVDVQGYLP